MENNVNSETYIIKDSDSILIYIKKMLGIDKDCTDFDVDIIIHINTIFTILNQVGIGPETGYAIKDSNNTWSEFVNTEDPKFESIKSYIYLRVKTIFDPPLNSTVMEAHKQIINELEWRLNITK